MATRDTTDVKDQGSRQAVVRRRREAWARIRAGLTELDIAQARHYAEASREALARYRKP
jgi:hypothetical protein